MTRWLRDPNWRAQSAAAARARTLPSLLQHSVPPPPSPPHRTPSRCLGKGRVRYCSSNSSSFSWWRRKSPVSLQETMDSAAASTLVLHYSASPLATAQWESAPAIHLACSSSALESRWSSSSLVVLRPGNSSVVVRFYASLDSGVSCIVTHAALLLVLQLLRWKAPVVAVHLFRLLHDFGRFRARWRWKVERSCFNLIVRPPPRWADTVGNDLRKWDFG